MEKELERNEEKALSPDELGAVSGGVGAAGETVIAYYEDGNTELLLPQGDGVTFLTLRGAVYYLGDDGVYRSRGYTELYAANPLA